MQGKSVDELRAKYNPLFATIGQYKAAIAEIRTLHAQGVLSTNEMAAAIQRHRQAALASIDAIKGRGAALRAEAANANLSSGMPGSGMRGFETANIAAQFQDIAVTTAMGISPVQIALQQGTQLAAVIGTMERPVAGLAAAFSSIISPVSLVTIGVIAASAATFQYFTSAKSGAEELEDLLEKEQEAIGRVRDLWGEAATERSRYGRESTGSATFGLDNSIFAMEKRLREANASSEISSAITSAVGRNRDATGLTSRQFRETSLFKALQLDFQALQDATISGRPDVLSLIRNIEEIGQKSSNTGLRTMAREAVEALKPFRDLAQALREAEIERRRLFADRGPNGMLLSRGTTNRNDMGDLALYRSRVAKQMEDAQRSFEAERLRLNARSPSERAAAARLSASLERRDEDQQQRNQRRNRPQ